MCGIAGFVERDGAGQLEPMLKRIAHRGPDGEGKNTSRVEPWSVSLGHRRLAIIDLESGAQPMGMGDGGLEITFNGEIYNYRELRQVLRAHGRSFRTQSDTEVILHHLDRNGPRGVADLNGMFAFALWNARERSLLLARDRAGIKPLFYAPLPDGGIVFASELSSLLAHGGIEPRLDLQGVLSYFFSDYVHAPLAMIRDVRKLPPGHTLEWKDGKLGEPRAFWRVPAPSRDHAGASEVWTTAREAVARQLVADVPVGAFLSGGIDSSIVTTLASESSRERMKAFAIGFRDPSFDESSYARMVAEQLRVEYIEEILDEETLLEVVDPALDALDEPLADPSLLPTFLLSRLASRHVKVVVGGDGGDELWGGYPTYRAHRLNRIYALLPGLARRVARAALVTLPTSDRYQSLEWKLRRFVNRHDDDPIVRHLRWLSAVDLPDLGRTIPAGGGAAPATLHAELPSTDDEMARLMVLDFVTYLPGSVLTKVDRATMAHGLEARPPLLDNEMLALAFALPSRFRVKGSKSKWLLKRAARGHLPDAVIDRPKKGFGIPLAAWLRGPLRQRLDAIMRESPAWEVVDRDTARGWRAEHEARRGDHAKALWALLVFDHWLRKHSIRVSISA